MHSGAARERAVRGGEIQVKAYSAVWAAASRRAGCIARGAGQWSVASRWRRGGRRVRGGVGGWVAVGEAHGKVVFGLAGSSLSARPS